MKNSEWHPSHCLWSFDTPASSHLKYCYLMMYYLNLNGDFNAVQLEERELRS